MIDDSATVLDVRLAGGLALGADGIALEPPASRRARTVLAYLALHPGPHARAELAARFWPDVLDASARVNLRAALTELRQALGPAAEHVIATRATVALDGDGLTVDARAFAQALDAGDAAAALAACRAPILDGFDDDWALAARDEHARRLADALEQVAAAVEDPERAVALTREQVALDPLAEGPNRRLVERLAAGGDRAAALAHGRQFAERLRTALGIAPSAETRALLDALRREDAPQGTAAPPRLPRTGHATTFVGRRAELARLRAAWTAAQRARDRRLVAVAGEPGIGKTRLVEQLAADAHGGGATVLVGRCSPEPLAPFEPFAEALGAAGLATVLAPGEGTDAGARHRLFDGVDAALTALTARAPLLLVLDDLHWADRATLLLLAFLLRSRRPGALLVCATYRDTELTRHSALTAALTELQRRHALERVALRGLAAGEVAELARAVTGSDALAEQVHARTNGNPFFVEEVLTGLARTGSDEVPESVRAAVGVRLSALGDAAGGLLAAAAILGLEHDVRALAATAGLEDAVAEAALDEVVAAGLLRPAGTTHACTFAHALVRDTVLAELNALRRARLHRRAAEALTALGEERHLEEIAAHLFEGADPAAARRAADMLVRAGRRAVELLAYEDAAERFDRALEALIAAGAQDEAGVVLLARGDALQRAGETAAADAAFEAARALALRRGDPVLLAEAALGAAGLGVAIVDLRPDVIARLEEALEQTDDLARRSRLQARLAVELYYAPDRGRSEQLSDAAITSARAAGDPGALAAALNARHVALWRPDRVRERLAVADDMVAAARAAGDRHVELQARNWRVTDLFELGDAPAWRDEMARHARLADELRLPAYRWYTPLWAAAAAVLAGRFAEAEALTAEALDAGTRAGDRNAEIFTGMIGFVGQLQRDAFAEIDLPFIEDRVANSPAGPAYRGSYCWILAGLGDHERARHELAVVVAYPHAFDANWLSAQVECAEAALLLDDRTHAATLAERLAPYAGRPVTAARAVVSYGAVDRTLGGLAALLGRRDDAVRHLHTAIRRNDELGCTVWRLRAQQRLQRITPGDPLVAGAEAEAAALGLAAVSSPRSPRDPRPSPAGAG